MYFFTPRVRRHQGGNRPSRDVGDGHWKAMGKNLEVKDSETEEVIGYKMALTYYAGECPDATKTNWIMHEYHVDKDGVIPPSANDMKVITPSVSGKSYIPFLFRNVSKKLYTFLKRKFISSEVIKLTLFYLYFFYPMFCATATQRRLCQIT